MAGIRYFDIRLVIKESTYLTIYHGIVDQKLIFSDVLDDCYRFLNNYPSETILMRIKKEDSDQSDSDVKSIFENDYRNNVKMHFGAFMPTIGVIRGKIMILSDFEDNVLFPGYPYASLDIQDNHMIIGASTGPRGIRFPGKYQNIKTHMEKATKENTASHHTMFLNYFSGAGPLANPGDVALEINGRVIENLLTCDYTFVDPVYNQHCSYGILAMDFPGSTLIGAIIKHNSFKRHKGKPVYTIRNKKFTNNYLYTDNSIYRYKERYVYGWTGSENIRQKYWLVTRLSKERGRTYALLFNTMHKEYLYSSTNEMVDTNMRRVFSAIDGRGMNSSEAIWNVRGFTKKKKMSKNSVKSNLFLKSNLSESSKANTFERKSNKINTKESLKFKSNDSDWVWGGLRIMKRSTTGPSISMPQFRRNLWRKSGAIRENLSMLLTRPMTAKEGKFQLGLLKNP